MELNVTYEIRGGYLYAKGIGEFGIATARTIFFECIEKARSHALNQILCDITLMTGFDAHETLTMTQCYASDFIIESLPKGFRLAILETGQQLTKDRFLENVLVNRGVIAKVTSSLDEALEWLGVTSANKADTGNGK